MTSAGGPELAEPGLAGCVTSNWKFIGVSLVIAQLSWVEIIVQQFSVPSRAGDWNYVREEACDPILAAHGFVHAFTESTWRTERMKANRAKEKS